MREILLPVVHPGAYRDRKYLTMNSRTSVSIDQRTASKLRHTSESQPEDTSNRSAMLGRTKSLSSNTLMKHHQQATSPPSSPSNQSKVNRLVKKLLKAGVDGDLGMVKFLLHWNPPSRANSNDVGTNAKEKSTTCHPLCECDNCIKMVSISCIIYGRKLEGENFHSFLLNCECFVTNIVTINRQSVVDINLSRKVSYKLHCPNLDLPSNV